MKSYTAREPLLNMEELCNLATEWVHRIPHHEDLRGREIRCHELARAFCHALRVRKYRYFPPHAFQVVDGTYARVNHSWIEIVYERAWLFHFADHPSMKGRFRAILDPYAVGSLPQVRLLAADAILASANALYVPKETRTDIREDVVDMILWSIGGRRSFEPPAEGDYDRSECSCGALNLGLPEDASTTPCVGCGSTLSPRFGMPRVLRSGRSEGEKS